jgi:hypothetical protein
LELEHQQLEESKGHYYTEMPIVSEPHSAVSQTKQVYEQQVYTVDPQRFDKNVITTPEFTKRIPYEPYFKPLALQERQTAWSYQDLRIFFEKYFLL